MTEFIRAHWRRAQASLVSARQLVETDPDSAASRAYYAAFHALTELFALRGQTFSKHSAIRAALHRDLVQPGILDKDIGMEYDLLMEAREMGDYGGLEHVPVEGARATVEMATRFLAAIERVCPEVAKDS